MITSECFHVNRVLPIYKYTDEYINFILKKIIYDLKVGSEQDIIDALLEYFNKDYIKLSCLKKKIFRSIWWEKKREVFFIRTNF